MRQPQQEEVVGIGDIDLGPNTAHRVKTIKVRGQRVDVDEEIVGLIRIMNNAGLVTLFSCQGGSDNTGNFRFSDPKREGVRGFTQYPHCLAVS